MIRILEDKLLLNRNKKTNELYGIELYFDNIPDADTRTELKNNGWKWYPAKKCWYNRYTANNEEFAKSILDANYEIIDSNDLPNTSVANATTSNEPKQNIKKPNSIENEHGYKIGDILVSEWGYSMSLVTAYQVIRVTAKSIYTKEIATETTDGLYGYSGKCRPVPNKFRFDKIYCSRTNNGNVYIDGHLASKWDGKKTYYYNTMD